MRAPLDAREVHRAASKQGTTKPIERAVAREEAADAGGVAEHLVEGHRDEVWLDRAEIQAGRRDERRGIEQDEPAGALSLRDELQWMLHAGEVRLRRERKQVRDRGVSRCEQAFQSRHIEPE